MTQIHYTTFEFCNSLLTAGPIGVGYSYEFEWTEKIPSVAFSGCYKMKSIVLPESITEIGSGACHGLYNLDSINLPEGLIRIGAHGLASSESVNELVLPKSLKELGSDPFSYCSSSTVITFQSTPALDDGFCVNHDITIRYPAGMGWNDEYKAYFDGFGTINWICYCMDGQHTVKAYTSNQDATCSADGTETGICIDCGESVTRVQTDTQLKHSYKNAFCIHCGHELDWINAPVISLTACADSSIDISWVTVDHAANYRIFRKSADSDSAKLLAEISDTTYSDTDTFPGTTYTYYVQAVAANDVVSEKSSASVTALLPPPTVKAGNDTTSGAIQLTWNAPTGAVCYEVYRAKSNGVYELLKTTTKTSLTDLGTVVGNTYSYKVTAVTKTGIASVSSKAVTGICLLPTTTLTASNIASTGKIQLKWNAVEGAESYKIYYATSKTATYKLLISTTSTSIKHTSAVAGQTYYYKVVAVAKNTKANSTSAVKSRTCDLVPPKVTISNDTATGKNLLKWGAVKNAVSYKIYRATSKTGKYSLQNTVTSTSYLDNSATTGKSYYYKVLAVASNTNANSDYSNVVNRLCDCAQPTVKVAASSTSYIKLSWNKVTGAKKYQVYQATSKTGTYKLIKTTTDTSLKISSVTAGKTYYYKVRAVASNTNANSAFSQILTAKATVAAPKLSSSVTATSSSIKISWEKVSNATGYYIYRRSSTSNSWTKIKTINSGSTTSFTNSVSGKYYYCVAAYKTVGRNTYTGFKSDAIRARTLAAPSKVSATAVNDTLNNTISWSKVTGATGYQLYRKIGDDGSWKLVTTLGSSTTSYTHKNVTKGEYYYYRVRAIYKTNGVTSYGPFKASGSKVIHSDPPKAMATMTATTALNTRSVAVFLYNQGDSPLKVYCNTGRWLATNSTLNRDITVSAFATEGITVSSKYITIAPGKGTSLIITAKSSTNYNKYTKICMLMNYEGVDYTTYCSSTGGFSLTYLS